MNDNNIYICVKTDYASKLLNLMIDNNVPFSIEKAEPIVQQPEKEIPVFKFRQSNDSKIAEYVYKKYIIENLDKTPPLINEIAEELMMSPSKFKALFRTHYKVPFYSLYLDKKMEYAAQLLKEGMKAKDVSIKVGYTHSIKFSKMFQKHFNITPKKYQQRGG